MCRFDKFVSKLSATVLIAALSTSVSVPFANAHAVLDLKKAPVNSYQRIAVRIGHGCDGQATQKVTVTIPEGIISVKPMPKVGWHLETVKGDYANEYTLHGEPVRPSEGGESLLRVGPGGVLGEDGAYDHLERRLGRPPAGVAIGAFQGSVHPGDASGPAHGRRV